MKLTDKDEVNEARGKFMIELGKCGNNFKELCVNHNLNYSTLHSQMYVSKYFDLRTANDLLEKMNSNKRFKNTIQLVEI
jgi:hypothetical protein